MLTIKTFSETVLNIINNIHDKLPYVDTKEGTFIRDTHIDPVANEFADVYDDLYKTKIAQSVLTATEKDLDELAKNYFVTRKSGTGSTGKVRFYITDTNGDISQKKFSDIRISKGTIVSTIGTKANPAIQFQTIDEIFISGTSTAEKASDNTTIISGVAALPKDASGYRYVDVLCEALITGSETNIGPYEIVSQSSDNSNAIYQVTNINSFTGGSDAEDDTSLALRICLALSGANIGTKNGYKSYMLKRSEVLDTYIVCAGDEYMQRDLLTVYDKSTGNTIEQHIGGKVDIYVRTNTETEDSFSYTVNDSDLDNDYHVPLHIDFPSNKYPITSLVSIFGTITNSDGTVTYKNYINAEDYEIEKVTDDKKDIYYKDILWDFSMKTDFPDSEYYPLPNDIDNDEVIRLKTKLDNELLLASDYLNNISYKINWDLVEWKKPEQTEEEFTTLFEYGQYTDDQFYKLKVNSNTTDGFKLNGRTFIKKEDDIYIRIYVNPDFKLERDSSDVEGSIKAKDYISWLQNSSVQNKPEVGENLNIKFDYNNGIADLQSGIETKRVVTADVLLKAAKSKDVEVYLSIICSKSYNSDTLKTSISNALAYHINTQKKLGGYLDISDLIYITKGIDGILSVNIDTAKLSFTGLQDSQIIRCKPNEYFNLKNLLLDITNSSDLQ